MPAVHECPGCQKKFKVPDGAEGKKMKCPGCQAVLLVTEDGLELAKKQAVQSAPPKLARKPPPPDEDEDEEEEVEKPAKAKKRKPIEEDEEEDEPKPRKRKAVVDVEEDEDERPARKKKRKKSHGGIPGWVWLAGGGGAAVLAVVLILVLFVFGGSNMSKVKNGMTEKEVIDLVGKPHIEIEGNAIWSNPKVTLADAMDFEKASKIKVKEALKVVFVNGKATQVEYRSGSDLNASGGVADFASDFSKGSTPAAL